MGQANWWLMDVVGPAILLIVLVWLVLRVRSSRNEADNDSAEQGSRNVYADEEQRRRDGTDKL
jgi:uncharacterized membrane protein